jgi:hypothetical protein
MRLLVFSIKKSRKTEAGARQFARRTAVRAVPFALFVFAVGSWAETPKDVLDFLRTAAEALADQDAKGFLDHFDRNMAGFSTLRDEAAVLATADVESTIEFVSDEGDDKRRELQLDWVLRVNGGRPRHELVQCRVEKQGKKWKITELRPVEFFAAEP